MTSDIFIFTETITCFFGNIDLQNINCSYCMYKFNGVLAEAHEVYVLIGQRNFFHKRQIDLCWVETLYLEFRARDNKQIAKYINTSAPSSIDL